MKSIYTFFRHPHLIGFFPLPENLFLHEVNKPLFSIGLSMSGARVLPQINVFIMYICVLSKQIENAQYKCMSAYANITKSSKLKLNFSKTLVTRMRTIYKY